MRSGSGTSPSAMRSAKPSTTAVLPTPASPVKIGLFWRRRVKISTIWRTSKSRPKIGSIFPALALAVKSSVYWSRALVFPPPPATGEPSLLVAVSPSLTASESSPEPAVTVSNSLANVSGEICENSREMSLAIRLNLSPSRANRKCPERTFPAPKLTEAINQAS